MLTRKAIVIAYPGEKNTDSYCKGVDIDYIKYPDFLMKPFGGLWMMQEIVRMYCPLKKDVENEIINLKSYDYGIVIFCGHGYYSSRSSSTIIEVNKERPVHNSLMSLRISSERYRSIFPVLCFCIGM